MDENTTTQETLFTKIINGEIPAQIIYEDEKHLAFLDIFPFEKGHTLVIPKKPYTTIFEMPEDEYLQLQKVVLKISKHLEKKLNCGLNLLQNNKKISGQEIMHIHFHLIPRQNKKKFYLAENGEKYLEGEIESYKNSLKYYR